jgi:hypothetical protein
LAARWQLPGDCPLRTPLHEHLVSNDMHEIHPEHPANPGSLNPARSLQGFRWSTFRAAFGLLSERRAHVTRQIWAIVVASPRLFERECRTPRQMKLANALCRYRELLAQSACDNGT